MVFDYRLLLVGSGVIMMIISFIAMLSGSSSSFLNILLPLFSLTLLGASSILSKSVWFWAGLGLVGWVISEILWLQGSNQMSYGSFLQVPGYLCLPLGIVLSLYFRSKAKYKETSYGLMLDGLIVGVTLSSLLFVFLFQNLEQEYQHFFNNPYLIIFIVDVLLLFVLLVSVSRSSIKEEWGLYLVFLGMLTLTISDFSLVIEAISGNYSLANTIDLGRMILALTFTAASYETLNKKQELKLPSPKVNLTLLCSVLALAVIVGDKYLNFSTVSWLFAVAALTLVIIRLAYLYAETGLLVKKQAQQAQISTNLMADMSHELRTPLTNIIGQFEEIEQSEDQEIRQSALSGLRSSSKMEKIIQRLLITARAQSHALDTSIVDIEEVIQFAQEETELLGIQHHTQIENINSCKVRGDKLALNLVFTNLLSNVYRHTPAGSSVYIAVDIENEMASIDIIDNGPGIPEVVKKQLWSRYAKGEHPESNGIGMSVIKTIVEGHKGQVQLIDSDKGTHFRIVLPTITDIDELSGN